MKSVFKTAFKKEADYGTKHGVEIYRRSLVILLKCAQSELYPHLKLQVGQSIMHGYFFESDDQTPLPAGLVGKLEKRMRQIVKSDDEFRVKKVGRKEAIEMFKKESRKDKVSASRWLKKPRMGLVFLRDYFDFMFLDCVASTGILSSFRLVQYRHGFVLQYPGSKISKIPANADRQEKLFSVYEETKNWNAILGIHHVPDLNTAIDSGEISTLIKIQEAFHEKKMVRIADGITEKHSGNNMVFIAGPSSSGKTTFVKRLAIQLRANGLMPEMIHLDDYFLPRNKTPLTSEGEPDFESINAVDVGLFRSHMKACLAGDTIELPYFDFKTGKRRNNGRPVKKVPKTIFLIEGLHGLNSQLTDYPGCSGQVRIFVSALTQLCIDYSSRIFTSDSRLMRRIVRDSMFRSHTAGATLENFPKVRKGEEKYVFPFQERAHMFFNSSIIYEQAVLKPMVEKLLKDIKADGSGKYYEACRLLNYLEFFLPLDPDEVPQTSILREFIGNSGFNY